MKTIDYITFNDTYNGIYQSQVIDVVNHLNTYSPLKVRLIAFVPMRSLKAERIIIKLNFPDAKVYPIPGKILKWRRCRKLLKLIKKSDAAICRGPIAFSLAHGLFQKCVYDARAAVKAEVEEYNVTGLPVLDKDFIEAEKFAIQKADFRIAVSHKLVEYWQNDLGIEIKPSQYVIIPCTLTSAVIANNNVEENSSSEMVQVIYSGGTSPWQSFDKVISLLDSAISLQVNMKVTFLTKEDKAIDQLLAKYPDRVTRKWLSHDAVNSELSKADYGILIRDSNLTNRVASPVKFAEYLNAGLKVLISEEIGDFSDFSINNEVGVIIKDEIPTLTKTPEVEKKRIREICKDNFFKTSDNIQKQYQMLVKALD